ncbi:kelch-like protein 2 isoform X2 [Acyrthosiphon pisum]|uniref:Kelch-like protein diablo n=1 Tax=Acyrthosiphon pisum TaxID=7029 RepID=A0A8R2D5J4_ACYPI|nr:kelch-like protein 2 isoform X2 [Acyrthosiphon pisum]|eukprot:XP_016662577.1 PREDICTED: kelch-like protein 2 isoform X2 [Acyrthosiphon pisum]
MADDQMDVSKSSECESTNYTNCSHIVKVFEVLQSLRKNEALCDITLKTDDGTTIFGHRIVLMSASQYFLAMFSNFNESKKDVVSIKELDSTVLQLLVDYIYTGQIMINKENVEVLLPTANLFQLDFVKSACIEFLETQLDPQNCLGIGAFADLHNCLELLSSSEAYIRKNFLDVVKGNEFLSLSTEKVIELISSNVLNAPSEEKVYECVINWVKHKLNDRYDSLPKLMEHVRLPLISLKYISTNVVVEPLLKNSSKCKDYIIEAFQLHALKTQQLITIPQTIRNTPRKSGQKVILVFSQYCDKDLLEICWYDPTTSLRQILTNIGSNDEFFFGLALIKDNFVLAMSDSCVLTLDLSLQSSSLVPLIDMSVDSRNYFGFGVIDGRLYVVGGVGKGSDGCLNSAEVFDMNYQEWRMISNMANKRFDMDVGVLNNLLYVVGGCYDDDAHLKSVECYDPILDTWTSVAEMSVCRSSVGVGVMDGLIYAVGGVLTLDGLLYVVSGYNDLSDESLESIEIYNPNTNTWSMEKLPKSNSDFVGGLIVDKSVVTKFI